MKKLLTLVNTKTEYDTKLALLYTLNITDYLFTLILISSGLFVEANPILQSDIGGTGGFIMKCILPLILLLYVKIRFCTRMSEHKRAVNVLIYIILFYYAAINLMHVFWLSYTVCIFI